MPIYTIKKITRQSYFESYWCFLSFNALLIKNVNVLLIFPIFPFFNLFVNKHLKERLKDLIHLSNSSTHYSSKCYQFDSWQFIKLDCLKLLFFFKKRARFCDVEQSFRLLVNKYWMRFFWDIRNHRGRSRCYQSSQRPRLMTTNWYLSFLRNRKQRLVFIVRQLGELHGSLKENKQNLYNLNRWLISITKNAWWQGLSGNFHFVNWSLNLPLIPSSWSPPWIYKQTFGFLLTCYERSRAQRSTMGKKIW